MNNLRYKVLEWEYKFHSITIPAKVITEYLPNGFKDSIEQQSAIGDYEMSAGSEVTWKMNKEVKIRNGWFHKDNPNVLVPLR